MIGWIKNLFSSHDDDIDTVMEAEIKMIDELRLLKKKNEELRYDLQTLLITLQGLKREIENMQKDQK